MYIPEPLHPAIVHFPIAFTFLGTLLAILSFIFYRKHFTIASCSVLILAAITAYFAQEAGGDAYDQMLDAHPNVETILNTHADNANATVRYLSLAAMLAIITLFTFKRQKFHLIAKIGLLLLALVSSYSIFQTAKYGGEMVYGDVLKFNSHNLSSTLEEETHAEHE